MKIIRAGPVIAAVIRREQPMKIRSCIPIISVSDLESVLAFYKLLGAAIQPDHDLGYDYVTVTFAQHAACFVRITRKAHQGLEGITLNYVCDHLNYWKDKLLANGIDVVACQDVGEPLIVEHQVVPELTICFEQHESAN